MKDELEKRAYQISKWLRVNHPEIRREQRHLDEGTKERAYWHYGYQAALRDVLTALKLANGDLQGIDARSGAN